MRGIPAPIPLDVDGRVTLSRWGDGRRWLRFVVEGANYVFSNTIEALAAR